VTYITIIIIIITVTYYCYYYSLRCCTCAFSCNREPISPDLGG